MQDLQLPQPSRTPERATVPSSQAGTHPTKKKNKKTSPHAAPQPCEKFPMQRGAGREGAKRR